MGPGWDASDGRSPKRLLALRGGRSDDDVASCKKGRPSPMRCDAMRCAASHHNTVVDGEEESAAVACSEQEEGEGPARTSKSLAE